MKLVVKAAVLNFITLLVRHGINLGIVIYTARHFGAASVGALSFFTILVGVFSVLGPFGIVSAYVQSNKDFPDSTFASSVIVSFVFCFVVNRLTIFF